MSNRQITVITVTAIVSVFAWSVAMVAAGQVTAAIALAPALGVPVAQIIRAARARGVSAPGRRVSPAAEQEDDAP
ncbi:hypothetical protein [Streptomyces niger]|uniref:hypothetical protein n=1 Tax=Streptomyces niger TaxID=66373 RepID=UPI0006997997|nr:hypothetical protein [Streptomyces niger]